MERLSKWLAMITVLIICSGWGFFAHQKINRLAVFTLPPRMVGFYKQNIQYIMEAAVNPDRRRYAVPEEAPRHYIDLDHFEPVPDTVSYHWKNAVDRYCEDSPVAHGIVPWHIAHTWFKLKDAFLLSDPKSILRISAELGHYVSDAHVPLHTTSNYDGQKTGQQGIHAFWESRLPELFSSEYDFFVGKASYVKDVNHAAWQAVMDSHTALDSVFGFEKALFTKEGDNKFSFETKGKVTVKTVAPEYARKFHERLGGMVERRMRASIKLTADLWYTAWVDAGQPDLEKLKNYQPTELELKERREELKLWKERNALAREHEN